MLLTQPGFSDAGMAFGSDPAGKDVAQTQHNLRRLVRTHFRAGVGLGVAFGLLANSAHAADRAPLAKHPTAIIAVDSPDQIVTFDLPAPKPSFYERVFVNADQHLAQFYLRTYSPAAQSLSASQARYEFTRPQVFWSQQEESVARGGLASATMQERLHRMTFDYFASQERPATTRRAIQLSQNVRASEVRLSTSPDTLAVKFGYDYFVDSTHFGLGTRRIAGRVQRTGVLNSAVAPQTRIECAGYYGDQAADVTIGLQIENRIIDAVISRRILKSVTAQIGTQQAITINQKQVDVRFLFDL